LTPTLAASNEAEMAKIEIYTAMACPFCSRAVKLLTTKNIAFEEIDVTLSSAKRQTMQSRATGRTSVPQIFINDNHIGGCDDLFALDQAGHLDKLLSMAS
jgi:glutaredoxin 3